MVIILLISFAKQRAYTAYQRVIYSANYVELTKKNTAINKVIKGYFIGWHNPL